MMPRSPSLWAASSLVNRPIRTSDKPHIVADLLPGWLLHQGAKLVSQFYFPVVSLAHWFMSLLTMELSTIITSRPCWLE